MYGDKSGPAQNTKSGKSQLLSNAQMSLNRPSTKAKTVHPENCATEQLMADTTINLHEDETSVNARRAYVYVIANIGRHN